MERIYIQMWTFLHPKGKPNVTYTKGQKLIKLAEKIRGKHWSPKGTEPTKYATKGWVISVSEKEIGC